LNIDYTGPLDGHDLNALVSNLKRQKTLTGPRLLHVVTKKGKGLPQAENEQVTYHAPGKFDPITGKLNPANAEQKIKYQDVFGKTLEHLSEINSKIVAITPAMPTGSGLVDLMQKFPDRCIDVGIAEQHAVTLAAGLATQGMLPFCVIYSTFLQRAYDQVLHDVALQKLGVVFCVDRAGIVGHDGPTHHGVFDIAFLRCIPNLTIAAPRNAQQLQNLLYTAQLGLEQPLAIRYPRGYSQLNQLSFDFEEVTLGKGSCLKEGGQIAILSLGTIAGNIQSALAEPKNVDNFAHFDLGFVKPLDLELLHAVFNTYERVVVFEEGTVKGGAGSAILEFAAQYNYNIPIELEGVPDQFISHGKPKNLLKDLGLDTEGICKKLDSILNKNEE
jgi:1-deoxy-D-xylulose-5-phosphate synthase